MEYIYIFLMIITILIVYGLLFRKKNNKIIKIFESFNTMEETNNELLYKSAIPELIEGQWTSMTTEIIRGEVTNTISFFTLDNVNYIMNYVNKEYKLIMNKNSTIKTDEKDGNQYSFNANPNLDSYRLPFEQSLLTNIPTMEMIDKDNNKSLIFKLIDGKLDNNIKTILESNSSSFNTISPNTSGLFYNNEDVQKVKNYKFSNDALIGNYISMDEFQQKNNLTYNKLQELLNKLDTKYGNTLTFQLMRTFNFVNDQKVNTNYSQQFNILIKRDGKILDTILHRPLKEELEINNLKNKFFDISTMLYFQFCTNVKDVYKFDNQDITISKDDLLLKNGASNYVENNISIPDINSVSKVVNSDYKPVPAYMINTYDKNDFQKGINQSTLIKLSLKWLGR